MKGIAPFLIFWQAHPFLRLLIPLIVGIVVADMGDGFAVSVETLCLCLLFVVWCVMPVFYRASRSYEHRYLFGFWPLFFFFLVGFYLGCRKWHEVKVDWSAQNMAYEARLADFPQEKDRSYLCPVQVEASLHDGVKKSLSAKVLLFLPKDSLVSSLQPGDFICFYGRMGHPENDENAKTFDYARYLYYHGVSGRLYTSHWQLLEKKTDGWREKALKIRHRMLALYRSAGLSGDELAVLSALTLGYKDDLNKDVRNMYSNSGAYHVLALSGLHVGILCLVVTALTSLLLRGKRLAWLRRLLMLGIVWMYVAVAGLPVSAVRAATMCSLFVLGSSFVRIGFSLNTLAVTAFIMLLYNPFNLFDVGFQLSFAAVTSILLLQPLVSDCFPRSKNPLLRYAWDITTVTIAAQIGVAPLILYYFSRFSLYFWLTNLFVVPMAYIIVCLTLPFFIVALLPNESLLLFFGMLLDELIHLMNKGIALVNQLPGVVFESNSQSLLTVFLFYILFAAIAWWIKCRRRSAFIAVLASVAALCLTELCEQII